MTFPNLICERDHGAISTIADFVDTTEERVTGILEGTIPPAAFEKRALSRFYEMPVGYLFNPDLQTMHPDKFQHREKMRQKLERARQIEKLLPCESYESHDCKYAIRIFMEGISCGITYADYRRACFNLECAERKLYKLNREIRVRARMAQEAEL